ncbi:tetratricopeptide repeat protein [Jiella sonneratiae]|uniref:Uncharacterized protein n=1 Tax=Jiella sonneratiae TaxID=2816856 RepID=A0ABS3IYV0_9HYPH|nr:hypothetical protein [Jiella sonneratiae]MBO0902593.1 hypothetical protein [Jiella sonneratiae]
MASFFTGVDFKFIVSAIISWPMALFAVCITLLFLTKYVVKHLISTPGLILQIPGGIKIQVPTPSVDVSPAGVIIESKESTKSSVPAVPDGEKSLQSIDELVDHMKFFALVDDRNIDGVREFLDDLQTRGFEEFMGDTITLARTFWLNIVGDETSLQETLNLDSSIEKNRTVLRIAARELDRRGDRYNSERVLERLKGFPEEHEVRALLIRTQDGVDAAIEYVDSHIEDDKGSAELLRMAVDFCGDKYSRKKASYLYKIVKLIPKDETARFELAFLINETLESAFQYKRILSDNPKNSMARNNLSTIYDSINLPIYAVNMLQKAAETGDDYPRGNLAIRLADRGFVDLAEKQIVPETGLHKLERRTSEAISYIATIRKDQSEKFDRFHDSTTNFATLCTWAFKTNGGVKASYALPSGTFKKGEMKITFGSEKISFSQGDSIFTSNTPDICYLPWCLFNFTEDGGNKTYRSPLLIGPSERKIYIFFGCDQVRIFYMDDVNSRGISEAFLSEGEGIHKISPPSPPVED